MTVCPLIVDELGLKHQVGRLTAVCRTTQVRDQQVTGCFRSCHRQQSLTTELHVSYNLVAVGHLLLADREATIRCCHEQTRGILNQTLMVFGLSQQCAVILQDTRMRVFTLLQDTQRSTANFCCEAVVTLPGEQEKPSRGERTSGWKVVVSNKRSERSKANCECVVYPTRLALQWILVKGFKLYSFQLPDLKGPVLLFFVTTSLCQDWVICAPAAFLGCGSNLSVC